MRALMHVDEYTLPASCSLSKLAIFVATLVVILRAQKARVAFLVSLDPQISAERFLRF